MTSALLTMTTCIAIHFTPPRPKAAHTAVKFGQKWCISLCWEPQQICFSRGSMLETTNRCLSDILWHILPRYPTCRRRHVSISHKTPTSIPHARPRMSDWLAGLELLFGCHALLLFLLRLYHLFYYLL